VPSDITGDAVGDLRDTPHVMVMKKVLRGARDRALRSRIRVHDLLLRGDVDAGVGFIRDQAVSAPKTTHRE